MKLACDEEALPERREGRSEPQFLDFTTGAISRLVSIDRPIDLGLAVSPDEKELLFTQTDYAGRDLRLVENFQ